LLVCLASACSRSFRRATLVDPFPSYFLAEDGGNDLNLFSACLNRIPPVSILTSITHDADANREALSDDVVVLLRWLMDLKGVDVKLDMLDQPEAALNAAPPTLNAAGVMVERRAQVRSEGLKHCFEMRLDHGDDPEFDQLEAQYGSVQAFHGSVYMHVWTYIYIIYIYVYVQTCIYMYIYIYIHTYIHMFVYIQTYIYPYIHKCICVTGLRYLCVHACLDICTYHTKLKINAGSREHALYSSLWPQNI
jgi:hypothetical protein